MSCCDETTARVPSFDLSRRSVLKGSIVIASLISAVRPSDAQGKRVKLAYCSQLLCGVPYEVARSAGLFKNHGLDVAALFYSLIESAKVCGVEPKAYLRHAMRAALADRAAVTLPHTLLT